jgi:streptogramin lyase
VVGEIALEPGGYPAAGGAASVWIANDRTGELQRLDLASKTMGAPITINPPTTEPYNLGAALDGSSLWVAGFQDRSLVLVDANRLALTRRIPISAVPYRIASDEGEVWLTDFDGSQVLQVDPADGSILRRIDLLRPTGIAIAPDAVWVATYEGRLVRLDRRDGTILDRSPIAEDATDLQLQDGDVWITGIHDRRLERYDPDRDAIVAWTDGVTALAFIDDVPWVATTRAAVVRLDPGSLRWTGAVQVAAELDQMVAEGGNLWVVGTRDGEQVLFRVRPDAG